MTQTNFKFQTGWEDCGCALVEVLTCSCGYDLLEGDTEYTASEDEIIECPNCHSKYQFIWEGMTIKKVE